MNKLLLIIYLLGVCVNMDAQMLKGRITDKKGEPVVGATLYVQEITQGSAADENGEFQLVLKPGKYTCEFSSLGFEKQVRQVEIGNKTVELNIQMEPAVYMLKEVKVTNSREDPAYVIMRKAIARAAYHRNQVAGYCSEVYTKGNMRLDKLPRLLLLGEDAKKTIKPLIGKLFLLESVMEVKFKAPDIYKKNVLAFSTTIPDDLNPGDALDIITASIYDPSIMGVVSPLAPGAFSYYRFRYVDCYTDGNVTVNKIRVEPRKQNGRLLDGWIYIADDLWCVVRFDVKVQSMGISARIKGAFHEVKPAVFLPTSYDIDVDVKILGVRATGKYYSSVQYKEVQVAASRPGTNLPVIASDKAVIVKSQKQQKIEKKIQILSGKEELSTREAYQLASLTQQALKSEQSTTASPLEIPAYGVKDSVTVDSMATKRDSLYWIQMRTLPLKMEEVVSYQQKDSMRRIVNAADRDTSVNRKNREFTGRIMMGGDFKINKKIGLSVDGIIRAVPEYNFVDGFWIGQKFGLDIRFDHRYALKISPDIYYATARKTLIWDVETEFHYAPVRRGRFLFRFGDRSEDYNRSNGAWRFENTATSLVYGYNFMKFYGKRYFSVENRIDVANGVLLTIGGKFEKRKVLENHIAYNFFKKDPEPNTPQSGGGVNMPDNTATNVFIQTDYTPRLHYLIRDGRKIYVNSAWPTFSVRYEKGIPNSAKFDGSYDRLDIGVHQQLELGIFDRFSYVVAAGEFLSKKELYFPDYKHFNTVGWILSGDLFMSGYLLADYYALSTDEKWLQGAVNYTSAYLFLKRLPFLQRYLFNEAVHFRYLWTPDMKHYTEFGYSLGFNDIGRIGVFVGFERNRYEGVGVRVSIPIKR